MRRFLALASLTLLAGLTACSGGSAPITPAPAADPNAPAAAATAPAVQADSVALADMPQVADGHAMAGGAIGVYYLERDPADPLTVRLTQPRVAEAVTQGNLFHLSVRPYMAPADLQVLGSSPGPNGTTNYNLRFTHPFDMPTNLIPPQSATKRADLFIFDVSIVLGLDGTQSFFGGDVVASPLAGDLSAHGLRKVGPLVKMSTLGVATANTFPYWVINAPASPTPAGNYDPATGWLDNEFLNPSGYDVVPQGASIDTTIRVPNAVTTPLPIVVIAKYMDPRNGTAAPQKRTNRLPNPADPTALRYFLPEACGDVQKTTTIVAGTLLDSSSTEITNVTAHVLDWDNASTVATPYPNQANVSQIAERSQPFNASISAPLLQAAGEFAASTYHAPTGALNEFMDIDFPVFNHDLTLASMCPP
ncbi:MAG: hypothetical protein ABI743_05925 [bacterium]